MTDGPPQPPPSFLDPATLVFPARVTEVRPTGIVLSQSRFVPETPERQSDAGRIGHGEEREELRHRRLLNRRQGHSGVHLLSLPAGVGFTGMGSSQRTGVII